METLLALVIHPQFASFVLGSLVPFLFTMLAEAGFPLVGKAKTLTSLILSVLVSFIPLVATWIVAGVPDDPEVIFGAMTAAAVSAELNYRLFWKKSPPVV